MSEYWKSTPSYWCKFCSTYVRDTGLERKNHEASGKHQNNIQRSLRNLHKTKEREDRDAQRAKDEVARLNGLVSGHGPKVLGVTSMSASATTAPKLNAAAQRKAHAEQLVALGVDLPEELKREVTGVGGWQKVSERLVEDDRPAGRSLADIIKHETDNKEDVKLESGLSRGVHNRRVEDVETSRDEEAAPQRLAWGSRVRRYPGAGGGDEEDLDSLLSGVAKRSNDFKKEEVEDIVKEEAVVEDEKPLAAIPDIDASAPPVKREPSEEVPQVVFKKRKVKR